MNREFKSVSVDDIVKAAETQMDQIFTKLAQQGDLLLRCIQLSGLLIDNSTYITPMKNFWKMPQFTQAEYDFLRENNICTFRPIIDSGVPYRKGSLKYTLEGFTPVWGQVFREAGENLAAKAALTVAETQRPALTFD